MTGRSQPSGAPDPAGISASSSDRCYELRCGFNLRTLGLIAGSAAFVWVAIVAPMSLAARLGLGGLFGLGLVFAVFQAALRELVMRVDEDGVTFGYLSLRGWTSITTPWNDIRRIILFNRRDPWHRYITTPYVGLQTMDPPSDDTPTAKIVEALFPGVTYDVIKHSQMLQMVRIKRDRLVRTVRAVAPAVEVVDLRPPGWFGRRRR